MDPFRMPSPVSEPPSSGDRVLNFLAAASSDFISKTYPTVWHSKVVHLLRAGRPSRENNHRHHHPAGSRVSNGTFCRIIHLRGRRSEPGGRNITLIHVYAKYAGAYKSIAELFREAQPTKEGVGWEDEEEEKEETNYDELFRTARLLEVR
ncbi:hypothetical protein ZHAS_00021187 [Anopheles sinensis]|uniref:Uncharacterized protein n=1 Tax=Anopheles sinensis TaxID=74873 RepID=A0A084WRR4_ANOSI|nr:hypothetical protein ZHAS_00021187 [Anopheles sinensis]